MRNRLTALLFVAATSMLCCCEMITGPEHQYGTILDDELWSAGTHHVTDTLIVEGRLTINPGAVVRFEPGASIVAEQGDVIARGRPGAPVVFTSAGREGTWAGLLGRGGRISLSYARVENAERGVDLAEPKGAVSIDHTVFRRIGGTAVTLEYTQEKLVLTDTEIDDAEYGLQVIAAAATLRNVVIRRARSGINCTGFASLKLDDVRIEGSEVLGLDARPWTGGNCDIDPTGKLTITGGRGYPALVDGASAAHLTADSAAIRRLLGNAKDTLLVEGLYDSADLGDDPVVHASLPWRLGMGQSFTSTPSIRGNGTLRIEPGATLSIDPGGWSTDRGEWVIAPSLRLEVGGDAARPARIQAASGSHIRLHIGGSGTEPNRISHTLISGITLVADSGTLAVDSSNVNGGGVELRTAGSRVTGSIVASPIVPVVLGAPGVRLVDSSISAADSDGVFVDAGGVTIERTEIAAAEGAGIVVRTAAGVQIHGCNLVDNVGPGVANLDAAAVDATGNWWGDPTGPTGPAGDGVAGAVGYEPFLTAPAEIRVAAPTPSARSGGG